MTEYILILFMWWSNPAMAVIDHLSLEGCQAMGSDYVKQTKGVASHPSYVCIERHG
jgi:hypothetical protein